MRHQGVLTALPLACFSGHGIQRMPEGVQVYDIGLPNGFIDYINRPICALEDAGTSYRKNLHVKVLTEGVLQILPVIIAIERRGDYGSIPPLRGRQQT